MKNDSKNTFTLKVHYFVVSISLQCQISTSLIISTVILPAAQSYIPLPYGELGTAQSHRPLTFRDGGKNYRRKVGLL